MKISKTIFKIESGHMCMVEMAIFNIQWAITLKVAKQELRFMCSACHLMVLTFLSRVTVHVFCMSSHGVNISVKFHENMSSGFKVMERTRKLLTNKGQ